MRRRFILQKENLDKAPNSVLIFNNDGEAISYPNMAKYLINKYPNMPCSFKPTNTLSIVGLEDIEIVDNSGSYDCAGKVIGLSMNSSTIEESNKIFLWTEAASSSMYVFFMWINLDADDDATLSTFLWD